MHSNRQGNHCEDTGQPLVLVVEKRGVQYAHQMQRGHNKERGKPIFENVRWVGMQTYHLTGMVNQKMMHINKCSPAVSAKPTATWTRASLWSVESLV